MTRRIYYESAYIKEFDAKVVRCDAEGDKFRVILDGTAFYPEGGGQPADKGTIDGVEVLDVKERDGDVAHYVASPFNAGDDVHGVIDFDYRTHLMQQHSGEHILSGIICSRFGCSNVGFHMGADFMTIDFDTPMTDEDVSSAEAEANRLVRADIVTDISYTDGTDGVVYRAKKKIEGNVRIVRVGGDCCACCGLHVARSGEIGIVKVLSHQRFKGGTRIFLVCGEAAYNDYVRKNDQLLECGALLSAKPLEIADEIRRLLDANTTLKRELDEAKMKAFANYVARLDDKNAPLIFVDTFDSELVGKFGVKAAENREKAAVFGGSDDTGYKYAFASALNDVRNDCKTLNTSFGGRGGGNAELCRGSVNAKKDEIIRLLEENGYNAVK